MDIVLYLVDKYIKQKSFFTLLNAFVDLNLDAEPPTLTDWTHRSRRKKKNNEQVRVEPKAAAEEAAH